MQSPKYMGLISACVLLVAAGMFIPGITWGLPSRAADPYLFGDRPPWDGDTIQELAGERKIDEGQGADVDVNPLEGGGDRVVVNATDAQRAEIVRRYRLYSYQPDEMVTLMALAAMSPGEGDFDPKLYQYGGLWVYGVGAMLKAASLTGLVDLRSDVTYYLDHPDAFGRFYVVARVYVLCWAALGVLAMVSILRRLTNGDTWAMLVGGLVFVTMPVVVNLAHEAKPHLPGVALMLLAIRAAMAYVDTGRQRWWWIMCGLCGLACGMVLTALPIAVLPIVVAYLRTATPRCRAVHLPVGLFVIAFIYAATNPYVIINLISQPDVFTSNLGNTGSMFAWSATPGGLLNGLWLITMACFPVVAVVGVMGLIVWTRTMRASKITDATKSHASPAELMTLLLWPAFLTLLPYLLLASGQKAEYARFALLPEVTLVILAAVFVVSRHRSFPLCRGLGVLLLFSSMIPGAACVAGFVSDTRPLTTRLEAAESLREYREQGFRTLVVPADPAPYVLPPVDLFEREIIVCRHEEIEKFDTPALILRPVTYPPFRKKSDDRAYVPRRHFHQWLTPMSFAAQAFVLEALGPTSTSPYPTPERE